jgi:hypothetical protein
LTEFMAASGSFRRIAAMAAPVDDRTRPAGRRRLDALASLARLDRSPLDRPPRAAAVVLATVASVAGSLAADALLVAIGTAVFPSARGYAHFHFGDYARLTVIGVLIASAGWPVVARITSAPRWLFCRLAVAVTVVLLLPDGWLLWRTQPPRAVAVLMVMHVAIAVVTYNALVRLAPVRPSRGGRAAGSGG